MDDEKKISGTRELITFGGLFLVVGSLCYSFGYGNGVKHARTAMLNVLNHTIENGETIISVRPIGSITEKWFQIMSLPGKPTDIIPVGNGWTI